MAYSDSFNEAFLATVNHEGGYVNDPKDRGGETNLGISKRAYPNEDIKSMTMDRAMFLYHRDYWDGICGEDLPPTVAKELFDAAVNCGVTAAIRMLQRAIGVSADGIMGPVTLATTQAYNLNLLRRKFAAEMLDYYTSLPTWSTHGRGWVRRVANKLRS